MALRLRRGTDAERQLITPESGELIYTTDTKLVFVGDGTTQGGRPVSGAAAGTELIADTTPQLGGNLDLNSYQIVGNGGVDISGDVTASGTVSSISIGTDSLSANLASNIQLNDDLNLQNADIIGTGNILINGTMAATSLGSAGVGSLQLLANLDLNNRNIIGSGNINIDGTITATGNINLGDGTEDNVSFAGLVNSDIVPSADVTYTLGTSLLAWRNGYFEQLEVQNVASIQDLTVGDLRSNDSTLIYDSTTDTLESTEVVITVLRGFDGGAIYDHTNKTMQLLGLRLDTIVRLDGSLVYSGQDAKLFADDLEVEGIESLSGTLNINSVMKTGRIEADRIVFSDNTNIVEISPSGAQFRGPLNGISMTTEGTVDDEYDLFTIGIHHDPAPAEAGFIFTRTRGDATNQQAVAPGDTIIDFLYTALGEDSSIGQVATINVGIDPAATIGTGTTPGVINLSTFNDTGTKVLGLSLNRNGEITVADNTLVAGPNSGEVDDSSAVEYLQITVGGTTYAMPLFAIRP